MLEVETVVVVALEEVVSTVEVVVVILVMTGGGSSGTACVASGVAIGGRTASGRVCIAKFTLGPSRSALIRPL